MKLAFYLVCGTIIANVSGVYATTGFDLTALSPSIREKVENAEPVIPPDVVSYFNTMDKNARRDQYELQKQADTKGYDPVIYTEINATLKATELLDKQVKSIRAAVETAAKLQAQVAILMEALKKLEAADPIDYPEACVNKTAPDGIEVLTRGFVDYTVGKYVYKNMKVPNGIPISSKVGTIGSKKPPVISRTTEETVNDAWYDRENKEIVCISPPIPVKQVKKLEKPKK